MCYGARDIQQDAVGFFAAHTVQTTASLTLSTDRQTAIKTITASRKGTFHLVNATIAINSEGERRVLKRGAFYTIKRDEEVLCESELPCGVSLQIEDGQSIEQGQIIASYDESITPLLAEQTGVLRFDALYSMITYEIDPITGISSQIVKAPILSTDPYPSIKITDPRTSAVLVEQYVPVGAIVIPMDGAEVKAGDLLAKILLKSSLQIRSAHDLFEVVPPTKISPLAAFDGTISYGRTHYEHGEIVRMIRLRSSPEDGAEVKEYVLSAWQTLLVQEREQVTAGTALAEGEVDLNELLEVSGPHEVARFFLKHLRTQTQMPPQHIELILRRMLSLVKITASGDSGLEEGEVVSRSQWQEEVERLLSEERTPPTAETLLLGVSALREHQRLSIQSLYEASAKTLSRLALSGEAVKN
jgi:DNA-directed RNA polymerase subunit beta'